MRYAVRLVITVSTIALVFGCIVDETRMPTPPAEFVRDEAAPQAPLEGPIEAIVVDPMAVPPPQPNHRAKPGGLSRLEGPLDEKSIERLQSLARNQAVWPGLAKMVGSALTSPAPLPGFDHLDFATAGQNWVPPDPELAVGMNHVVSVVNDAMYITDLVGNPMAPPISLPAFFAPILGCTNLFDPNVLYDEQLDRFIVGMDANGTGYCVAMSQTFDPSQPWNAYGFGTVPPPPVGSPDFFDYPHAGVGELAVYMGANIYDPTGSTFKRAEVWAIDKLAMAAGAPLPMPVSQVLFNSFTPQPMNAHGWSQGTWPFGQPHVIMANQYLPAYSADLIDVWHWTDPFGANSFFNVGFVDLAAATGGVPGGYPVPAPQNGGLNLQANDWRVLDNEYRNGHVWVSQTISCNPGAGAVDCIRWAEVDPLIPAVLQAGVLGTDGEYRTFPDLAVNHCDDMTIGYTKLSNATFPEVWASGRLGIDPPGMLAPELPLKPAVVPYVSWDGPPHRWGDYSGATSGPDGVSTWFLGEYSKNLVLPPPSANWGTWVNEFTSDCGADLQTTITNNLSQVVPGTGVTYTITVSNAGRGDSPNAFIMDIFPAILQGVTWACADQPGPPTSVCGAPSGSGDINLPARLDAGSMITLTAIGVVNPTATGMLTNSVTAANQGIPDPNPGNDMATDSDPLTPQADLFVSVTDGISSIPSGHSTTYTVTVASSGMSDAPSVIVTDSIDPQLTITSWTCAGDGIATCGSPSGSGNLSDTPSLPASSAVTYSVNATVTAGATGSVTYSVTAQPGGGVTDPNPSNNTSADTNTLITTIFVDDFESGNTNAWSAVVP